MIDYGSPPAADEIEVTLFGPGYGEAIAVHLGGGEWMLVDSCIDPEAKVSASGVYLDKIGVMQDNVRVIVATHWHDDHVRGLSQLASKYPSAELVCSAVFGEKEANVFLSAYGGDSSSGLARGAKELFSIIKARRHVFFALHRSIIVEGEFSHRKVRVTALSPLPRAHAQSITHFAQYLPKKGAAINAAPEVHPNFVSIVLHIDLENDAILLGADLEDHADFGWSAVVTDSWSGGRRPATAYKVAHHGSITGDCPQIWTDLLEPGSVACLTPWMLAGKRLPTKADQKRVKENSSRAYIASAAGNSPQMDGSHLKRLKDIAKNVKLVDSDFGVVRLRKTLGACSWSAELFGAAQQL